MKRKHFIKQFNWRMVLVRIVVNALALVIISILPDIHFLDPTILRVLFVGLILGVLNAFIKPIVQFLTLRFIFITFGFAVIVINTIMLLILGLVAPNFFVVDSLIWAIVAAALMGLIVGFLENLLGLQLPIMPEGYGLESALTADPSRAFESLLASEVIGSSEELTVATPVPTEMSDSGDDDENPAPGEEG